MALTESQRQFRGPLVLAIVIIVTGVGWLLTSLGYGEIHWVWTLGLGLVGVLTFVFSGGFDKVSIVVGPFFLVGSLLSVLRQTGRLRPEIEVPVLVILIGVLLVLAQLPSIPLPRWFADVPGPNTKTPTCANDNPRF